METIDPNTLTGAADGDSTYDVVGAPRIESTDTFPSSETSSDQIPNTVSSTTAGTAQQGSSAPKMDSIGNTKKTDRRRFNPLSKFSSYTYNLTLYMIKPETYNAFVNSGRRNIDTLPGVYVVAKSGGVNLSVNKRAPGFKYDYYIDNLKLKTNISGKATQSATATTDISFNITEPNGFSLITKLHAAHKTLLSESSVEGLSNIQNPTKQFFILKISFQGYDKNGKVVTSKDIQDQQAMSSPGSSSALFESYYDLTITKMKFKINGKVTVYDIEANCAAPTASFGIKKGRIDNNARVIGNTVEEILAGADNPNSLVAFLNKQQQDLAKEKVGPKAIIPNEYSIVFLGDSDGPGSIRKSTIVSPADKDKSKTPMSDAVSVTEVQESTASKSTPQLTKRQIQFNGDISIIQAITNVIKASSYIEDALTVLKTAEKEPDPTPANEDQLTNSKPGNIKWFNVSSEVEIKAWDTVIGDWAYKIKYIIQPYETPLAITPYAAKETGYYGPHKRYDYWLTGQNTEVISYEQQLNNSFYAASLGAGDTPVTVAPTKRQNEDKTNKIDRSNETQNSYLTSLYDPESWATAKVQILGDPDFLMQDSPSSVNELYSQFYGNNGFTINPTGGQVFVEINFKEGVDYDINTGTLDMNEALLFWKYPASVKKIVKGIAFQLQTVESTFSHGKFTQTLNLNIHPFSGAKADATDDASRPATSSNTTTDGARTSTTGSTTNGSGSVGSANSGYVPYDEMAGYDDAVATQAAVTDGTLADMFYDSGPVDVSSEITSPTGTGSDMVADDDAVEFSTLNVYSSDTTVAQETSDGRETTSSTTDSLTASVGIFI